MSIRVSSIVTKVNFFRFFSERCCCGVSDMSKTSAPRAQVRTKRQISSLGSVLVKAWITLEVLGPMHLTGGEG